jgi:formylglycine-generating enzyme required for sulfatase activity
MAALVRPPVLGRGETIGFHDMLGNAWEWVGDRYADCTRSPRTDPTGPASGTQRTIRGSCFKIDQGFCRASHRYDVTASDFASSTGFRVARTP